MVRKSEPEQQPVGKGHWCSPAWVHVDVCCPQRVHWAQQMLRGGKSLTENQTTKQPAGCFFFSTGTVLPINFPPLCIPVEGQKSASRNIFCFVERSLELIKFSWPHGAPLWIPKAQALERVSAEGARGCRLREQRGWWRN